MLRWLRYPFEVAGALVLSLYFCLLPRAWAHRGGRRLGAVAYLCSRRSRNVALENLRQRLHLGDAEARRLAVESHRKAGAAIADMLRAPRCTRKIVRRDVEIPDAAREQLETLRRPGGAVLASSHFGNWEFWNLCWPHVGGAPATVVVRSVPNPILNAILFRLRGWSGQEVIDRGGALRHGVRRVRAGGKVMIAIDLPVLPGKAAVPIDFFDLPAFTTLAAGYCAAAAGAPAYLSHLLPIGKQRYRAIIKGPFLAPRGAGRREAALAITLQLSDALEAAVREHPDAWAWWIKRWRARPEGAVGAFPSYAVDERWL